mmetsp:Transcript_60626/g.161879  ORF Transcript_60626/g.161879 Transcript_60626/m.161879 type:complete len:112 (-) Transcript_60626:133-468(-)
MNTPFCHAGVHLSCTTDYRLARMLQQGLWPSTTMVEHWDGERLLKGLPVNATQIIVKRSRRSSGCGFRRLCSNDRHAQESAVKPNSIDASCEPSIVVRPNMQFLVDSFIVT